MKYRLLLLLAALIWGCAFVAQVIGMDSIGPYAFNGIRFLLGSLSLLPIVYYYPSGRNPKEASFSIWVAILMAGILLCGGATLQQVALQYTTASKTSFLTATYLLMVPVIGLFFGQVLRLNHIFGVILAMAGVYFISITETLDIGYGDFLVLLCAVCYAAHIILLNYLTQRFPPVTLSSGQFMVVGICNLILAFFFDFYFKHTVLLVAHFIYRHTFYRCRIYLTGSGTEISPCHGSHHAPKSGNGLWRTLRRALSE